MICAQALAAMPVVPMESQAQVTSAAVDTAKKVLDTKADSASPKKAGCFSCFSGTPSPCQADLPCRGSFVASAQENTELSG